MANRSLNRKLEQFQDSQFNLSIILNIWWKHPNCPYWAKIIRIVYLSIHVVAICTQTNKIWAIFAQYEQFESNVSNLFLTSNHTFTINIYQSWKLDGN